MKRILFVTLGMSLLAGIVACSSEAGDDEVSPVPVDDATAAQAIIYSTNAAGTWTAEAFKPVIPSVTGAGVTASAAFTGPSGYTRKMGVCALKLGGGTCSTVADCSGFPATLPTGGARYCTQAEGDTAKRCYFRGASTSYCAGSPALGGAAVAPGTFTTPSLSAGRESTWLSYGCFEGCAATDPSVSSAAEHYKDFWSGSKK